MNMGPEQFVLKGHDFEALGVAHLVNEALGSLSVDTVTEMPWLHASTMVQPPTNRWFSGLAFGSPEPVFPMPYSYMQTDQGFVFGLPHVSSSRHTVYGPATPDVDVNVGACAYRIASCDLASVTIEFLNEIGRVLGRAVLAEGVPYVSYTAVTAHDVGLSEPFTMNYESCATHDVDGRLYGLVTTGAFSARSIRLQAGDFISLIAFPQFVDESAAGIERAVRAIARHASFPVIRTEVSAEVQDSSVSTTIKYVARDNGPVAVVRMGHQAPSVPESEVLGLFSTVYGTMPLVSAKSLQWTTPKLEPSSGVSLEGVTAQQREIIERAVVAEIAADLELEPVTPQDTYFAGKSLYRSANLLYLADQLGVENADAFATHLEARFAQWFRPQGTSDDVRTFIFDDVWGGVVGLEASFGADTFDEHLTHYGYFLFTAAVLGQRNPSLVEQWGTAVSALAFDIATPVTSTEVPALRGLDIYKGHSWALGTGNSEDGNVQKSSTESVSAWNAVSLWARVAGLAWLDDLAVWAMSLEAESARRYFIHFDDSDPVRASYRHTVVPMAWGGKHDFASWFSGETSAMLGVLLLPMSPVATYLAGPEERIAQNVEEAVGYYGEFNVQYGDYVLMYRALSDSSLAQQSWEVAQQLDEGCIDAANSRGYMLAWIAARTR